MRWVSPRGMARGGAGARERAHKPRAQPRARPRTQPRAQLCSDAPRSPADDDKVVGDDTQNMQLQDMGDEDVSGGEWASRPGTPRNELIKQEMVRRQQQQQQQQLAKRLVPEPRKLQRAFTRQIATKMITGANKQLRSMKELHEGQIAAERQSALAGERDGAPAPGPAAAWGPLGGKEAQVT